MPAYIHVPLHLYMGVFLFVWSGSSLTLAPSQLPMARPAAGRQRLPTHQATLSLGPWSSRGLSKTKRRRLLTPFIPAHFYTTGVNLQNLANELSKRAAVSKVSQIV